MCEILSEGSCSIHAKLMYNCIHLRSEYRFPSIPPSFSFLPPPFPCASFPFPVLDVLAQLIMAWMLLSMSLGWTLGASGHPIKDNKQLVLIISVAIVEVGVIPPTLFPLSLSLSFPFFPSFRFSLSYGSSLMRRVTTPTISMRTFLES